MRRAAKHRGLPESAQSFIRGVGTPRRQSAVPHQAPGPFSFYKWKCARRQAPGLFSFYKWKCAHRQSSRPFARGADKNAGRGFSGPDFTQQNAPPFSGALINLWMYRIRLIGATVFDTILALFFIRPGDGGFNFFQPLKRRCRQARIGGLKLCQPRAKRHGLRR